MTAQDSTWTVRPLLDIVTIRSGQVDPRLASFKGLPLIAPDHIESGSGRLLEVRTAEQQGAISGKYLVDAGDIVYSKIRPYLRKVYRAEFPALCSADMYPMKPKRGVDGSFILNTLLGRDFTNFAVGASMRSGIPKINRTELAEYKFAVPPSGEQRAIGATLREADETILAIERLIAKQRDVRTGMMQELLGGRTRLGGFDDDWRSVKLGELGTFLRGRGIKRDDVRSTGVPCIRYGELYTTYRDYTSSTVSFVDPSMATMALPIRRNDVLFAASGETKNEIGMSVAYVGESPAVAGGDVIVLRGRGYDPIFLSSLLNTPAVVSQKARGAQGDAVVHINWRALAAISLAIPSHAEQAAIARVLLETDAGVDALTDRLQSARDIKTGMMQALLTGRTRLPAEEAP